MESWIIKPDVIEHIEGIHMTMNALARYDCTTVCLNFLDEKKVYFIF